MTTTAAGPARETVHASARDRTGGAPARGATTSWQLRTAPRRVLGRWRVLGAVGLVALLATTLLCGLALLVTSAEDRAVRAALAEDPARNEITVVVEHPEVPVAEVTATIADELRGRLDLPTTARVHTEVQIYDVPREGTRAALAHLAEMDDVEDAAVLLEGEWPAPGAVDADGTVPVAVPAAARVVLGAEPGTTHTLAHRSDGEDLVVRVVGVYDVSRPDDRWSYDRMRGRLHEPAHPLPGSAGRVTTDAVGPLVLGRGAADLAGADVYRVVARHTPDLGDVAAGDLGRLRDRLSTAETGVSRALDDSVRRLRSFTQLPAVVAEVETRTLVTRASVVVVGLLTLALAVAALLQSARLLAEVRLDERDLMRARGASRRQLLVGAALEVVPVVLLVGAAAPLLAPVVVRALGSATGLAPAVDAPSAGTWLLSGAVALLLGLVLLVPLVRAPETFAEAQQARARPGRRAVLARSGLDVLVLALAVLATAQLATRRSVVAGAGIDPVLVVAPAVVLLAGALLAVRLLPLAARLGERVVARGRGAVGALAVWEVARRPARTTSAVVLLTVALGLTSFGQVVLATWERAQTERAWDELGAPVVVEDAPGATTHRVGALAHPTAGRAQPVVRAGGTVWASDVSGLGNRRPDGGAPVTVLGAADGARAMLDRDRLATEGGSAVAALPSGATSFEAGIDLGEDVAGLTGLLELRALDGAGALVEATVSALVADAGGLVETVELGRVDATEAVPVRVPVGDPALDPAGRDLPLRLVGLDVELLTTGEPATSPRVRLAVRDLGVVRSSGPLSTSVSGAAAALAALEPEPVETGPASGWVPLTVGAAVPSDGAGGLTSWLDLDRRALAAGSARVVRVAWEPGVLPAVMTTGVAADLGVGVGDAALVGVDGVLVPAEVAAVVPRVPTIGGSDAVVVDAAALSRAVVERGGTTAVDAWWVDVAERDVPAYLAHVAALPPDLDGGSVADRTTAAAVVAEDRRAGPAHAPVPAALWLATAGAAVMAALGFAVHAVVTLRARQVEIAQLRALGLGRARLGAAVLGETAWLSGLGVVLGLATGVGLARLVAPLVASAGSTSGPSVTLVVPAQQVLGVSAAVVAGVVAVVAVVVRVRGDARPGFVLRAEAGR